MSAHTIFTAVGTLLGGLIGYTGDPIPCADPTALHPLLADLGVTVGANAAELDTAIRHFQQHVGLHVDGVAGPVGAENSSESLAWAFVSYHDRVACIH
jgi:putative peptidoglycan binding protein